MTALAKLPELPKAQHFHPTWPMGRFERAPLYTAEQMEAYARAALSPAELGGVERDVQRALRALTEHEWISEDGCASLAANDIANTIRKLSTPRAAEAVSEETNKAVADLRWLCRHYDQTVPIGRLRLYLDRLEASLTPPSAKGESSDG